VQSVVAKAVGKKCPSCGVKMTKAKSVPRGGKKDMVQVEKGHIISRVNGGNNSIANLRPVCARCNNRYGTRNMPF
jgi:5-methylcytosine-specific restriction endonuclease McrA